MTKIKTYSPKQYAVSPDIYKFPFIALDSTPGGSNLGRIEWHIELIKSKKNKGRYFIDAIRVWATQTRNREIRKLYTIPCHAECLTGHRISGIINSFTDYVWRISYCRDHGIPVMSAYPENNHRALVIDVQSSIGIDVYFE